MKKTSLLLLVFISFSSFASEKLNCWIVSKNAKTEKLIRKEYFKVEVTEGLETKIGELYSGNFFASIEENGEYLELTILAKDSTGKIYSSTSSQLGRAEQGAIMSSCGNTNWYTAECIEASEETGEVGCSIARKIRF